MTQNEANKKWRDGQAARGLCIECRKRAAPGRRRCRKHLKAGYVAVRKFMKSGRRMYYLTKDTQKKLRALARMYDKSMSATLEFLVSTDWKYQSAAR